MSTGNNYIPENETKSRVIHESVPGKQMTLAHIIANPDDLLYRKLGLDPSVDYSQKAIGIMTLCPSETAIIAADVSMKASASRLGFVDRFSGTVIITGTVSEVESALQAVIDFATEKLGFTVCPITKT